MKAKGTRNVQPKQSRHMSDEAFVDLKGALQGALGFERAEQSNLQVTRIRAPQPPKAMSPKNPQRSDSDPIEKRAG